MMIIIIIISNNITVVVIINVIIPNIVFNDLQSIYLFLLPSLSLSSSGAGIAQLVVLGLAVHSVAGSILLWGHFPVEGIFPLELTWVQTPFPPKLFRMRV